MDYIFTPISVLYREKCPYVHVYKSSTVHRCTNIHALLYIGGMDYISAPITSLLTANSSTYSLLLPPILNDNRVERREEYFTMAIGLPMESITSSGLYIGDRNSTTVFIRDDDSK